MAYEVGTGYLSIVPSFGNNFSRLMRNAGQDMSRSLTRSADAAGDEAGGAFSNSFGKIMKAGAIVASVAAIGATAGAAFSKTFGEAVARESSSTVTSAALGLSEADSKALGASAGKLYSQAYGESFSDVSNALGVVKSSLKGLGKEELETATKTALSFSSVFEVDMARSVQSVSTLMGSGLVDNATEAFDLLTKASQSVPAALREDILDASDEYGQFFNALGFDGAAAFGALTAASSKGVFGIDKTGDAIKEFTIRATDMSKTSVDAFSAIGLDAQTMANNILAGGDTAQGATQQIIDGLLGIQDPATQANTAIALFGTPLEDLGVSAVPEFLSSLNDASGGLKDFEGAAAAVDDKVGGTIQAKLTGIGRSFANIGVSIAEGALPFFGPLLDKLSEFVSGAGSKVGPAMEKLGDVFSGLADVGGPILKDTFGPILDVFKEVGNVLGPAFIEVFETLKPAVMDLLPIFKDLLPVFNPIGLLFKALLPVLPQIATLIGDVAKVLAEFVAGALTAVAPLFQKLVDVVNRLLPIITDLVMSLLPPLMGLFDKLAPLLDAILAALLPVVDEIVNGLMWAIDALMPVVERVFGFIGTTIENIMTVFGGFIDFVTGVFTGDWSKAWDGIKTIFSGIWEQMKDTLSFIWETIQTLLSTGWNWIRDNVFTPLGAGVEAIEGFFDGLWTKVVEVWDNIQTKVKTVWDWINQNVFAPLNLGINTIITFFGNLWAKVEEIWNNVSNFFGDIAEEIGGAVDKVEQAIEDILKAVKGFFVRVVGGTDEGGVFGNLQGSLGAPRSHGGIIPGADPGRGIDNVLTPMRSGEAVMVPEWTKAVGGAAAVHRMNRLAEQGRLGQGFSYGGIIGEKISSQLVEKAKSVMTGSMGVGGNYGPENYSGLAANTAAAKAFITKMWGITNIGGWRASGSVAGSDHPKGKALDVMIANYLSSGGIAQGNSIADWFVKNPANFGTKYVIWRDRINQNGQWSPYSHPGGNNDTLAHRDHVHISFLSGLSQAIGQVVGDMAGGSVERWRPMALQALAATGQSASHIGRMLNQIRSESGGDPNAQNNWDINAKRGYPSQGLLQVIQPTFERALRGTQFAGLISRGPKDPWANMIASILYGSGPTGPYKSLEKAYRGVAYDRGGWLEPFGGNVGLNFLKKPEAVLDPDQSAAYVTHAKALAAGWRGEIVVNNYIDGEQFDSRTEVIVDGKLTRVGRGLMTAAGQVRS